jgi:hypothetical protein
MYRTDKQYHASPGRVNVASPCLATQALPARTLRASRFSADFGRVVILSLSKGLYLATLRPLFEFE